jgi:hypothetical protein
MRKEDEKKEIKIRKIHGLYLTVGKSYFPSTGKSVLKSKPNKIDSVRMPKVT